MVPAAIGTRSAMASCAMRGPHAKTYTIFRSRLKNGISNYLKSSTSYQNQQLCIPVS